jgi:hypothetical protein
LGSTGQVEEVLEPLYSPGLGKEILAWKSCILEQTILTRTVLSNLNMQPLLKGLIETEMADFYS